MPISITSDLSAPKLNNSNAGLSLVAPVKMDGNNYLLWKSMIPPIIRGNRLEGFLDGSRECPSKFVAIEDGHKLNEKYEEWHVMDQILLG